MPRLKPGLVIPDRLKKQPGRPPKYGRARCALCGKLKNEENTSFKTANKGVYLQSDCKDCCALISNIRNLKDHGNDYLRERIKQQLKIIGRIEEVINAEPDNTPREIAEKVIKNERG